MGLICKAIQELLSDNLIDAELFRKVRRELNEEKSIDLIDTDVEEDVEADLADTVCDLVERLVAVFGAKYVAIFEKHCGAQCRAFLSAETYETGYEADQVLALSMLTELVRHGGQAAHPFVELIVATSRFFLSNSDNGSCSAQIRQSVSYALGVCAQSKLLQREHAHRWLDLLTKVATAADAKSEENADATENAISAIGKICEAYILPIGLDAYAQKKNAIVEWMCLQPLINDEEERHFCDEYLLSILQKTKLVQQMVDRKDVKLIGKLVHIMAVAIVNGDKAKEQYVQLFAHLKSQCDAALIQHCVAELDEEWQAAFSGSQ